LLAVRWVGASVRLEAYDELRIQVQRGRGPAQERGNASDNCTIVVGALLFKEEDVASELNEASGVIGRRISRQ
jgi:hypothetical protein